MNNLIKIYKIYVNDIDMFYKMGNQCKEKKPEIEKIMLHGSSQEIIGEKKQLVRCVLQWELLTLQRPIATKARRNIASYSLREKTPMGVQCTLRGKKMHDFLTRLLFLYLPRMNKINFLNPFEKSKVWTYVFEDIRSFLEVEYFFQYFENYPGIQCSVFFKNIKKFHEWNFIYLSGFAFPFEKN